MIVELDDTDRQRLRQLQKTESAKRDYVKITVIIMLDWGKPIDEVADLLGIDHTTNLKGGPAFTATHRPTAA